MCGIFGAVSSGRYIVDLLIKGLSILEYRGYDSCGMAILNNNLEIESRKSNDKVIDLQRVVDEDPLFNSFIGIAHTRWATHGVPNIINAHPVHTNKVAVVHNGIIENYIALRSYLEKLKIVFNTDTDTEVIPNLITMYLNLGFSPEQSVHKTLDQLQGSFSIVALFSGYNDLLIAAKKGMSLAVGKSCLDEHLIASDVQALSPFSKEIMTLEDYDIVKITSKEIEISNHNIKVKRNAKFYDVCDRDFSRNSYPYFTLKEISEQPQIIRQTLDKYFNGGDNISIPDLSGIDFCSIDHITIVGCGSSYFAGLIAKYWLQKIAKIRVHLEISSEFRYNEVELQCGGVMIFISQSGETVDTIEALRYAKRHKQYVISITNIPDSTMEKLSDVVLRTFSGIEIGVASTKTFSSQLSVLACFTLWLAQIKVTGNRDLGANMACLLHKVKSLPEYVEKVLEVNCIDEVVDILIEYNKSMIIGRGVSYGVALEGALKIKELSYINTLGMAAGEMKHGSIALVDESMPVIVIMPYDDLFFKNLSNIQEIIARKGVVIVLTDKRGVPFLQSICHKIILLPEVDSIISPIIYTIPMQLIAYFMAIKKGINADQPRNLAKSVTVE